MGSAEVEGLSEDPDDSCSSGMTESSPLGGGIGIASSGECGTGLLAEGRLGYIILSLVFLGNAEVTIFQMTGRLSPNHWNSKTHTVIFPPQPLC